MSQVNDIIGGISHRITDRVNIYPALNRAVRLIAKRLYYHKSSWVRGALSVSISADASTGTLPSDYWGLIEKPYISTKTYPLEPVPDQNTKLNYTDTSTPIYYEISGLIINLYPGSTGAITLNGQYWQRQSELTGPGDTMPFNELLDDAIQEVLLREISGADIGIIQRFINKAVDEVIPYTDKFAPKRVPDNAGLNQLVDGGL